MKWFGRPVRKWFFALNETSLQNNPDLWESMILVAVNSALRKTDLEPHLIFDGEDCRFLERLSRLGVKIIKHRLSFYDDLERFCVDRPDFFRTATGAFLRVDIPKIEVRDKYIIYTDCDVMFISNPSDMIGKPKYFACTGEFDRNDAIKGFNSGIMVMNLVNLRKDYTAFIKFIKENIAFDFLDQEAYHAFYKGRVTALPDEMNWKPYWGPHTDVRILHFHGPKPNDARIMLEDPESHPYELYRSLFRRSVDGYEKWTVVWNNLAREAGAPLDLKI